MVVVVVMRECLNYHLPGIASLAMHISVRQKPPNALDLVPVCSCMSPSVLYPRQVDYILYITSRTITFGGDSCSTWLHNSVIRTHYIGPCTATGGYNHTLHVYTTVHIYNYINLCSTVYVYVYTTESTVDVPVYTTDV